jgi:hypothetical protein
MKKVSPSPVNPLDITVNVPPSQPASNLLAWLTKQQARGLTTFMRVINNLGIIITIDALVNLSGKPTLLFSDLLKVLPRTSCERALKDLHTLGLIKYDGITIRPTNTPAVFSELAVSFDETGGTV